MSARLDDWQNAGDERMWKFILSPEFGDRIDLKRLTRDLMDQVKNDLGGGPLEWVAVVHYNTEHPHVHVALRGINSRNQPLHLDRDYVKSGMRRIADDQCTRQLGYRTELDARQRSAAKCANKGTHRWTVLSAAQRNRMIALKMVCNFSRSFKTDPQREPAMICGSVNSTRLSVSLCFKVWASRNPSAGIHGE
jgi:type IV secretory pathway VirD2 relaxase